MTGENYPYQMHGGVTLLVKDGQFAPFVGLGANGVWIDAFSLNQNDFGQLRLVGSASWGATTLNGQPTA